MLLRKLNRGVVNITCVQNVRKASNKISDGFGDMKTTNETDKESTPRELKEWRNIPEWMKPRKRTFHNEDEVTLDRSFMFFSTEAPSKTSFSLDSFSFWLKNTKIANEKSNQKYLEERHMILGSDLAIAHFILFRGGKVQFSGNDEWHTMREDKSIDLPNEYDSAYIVRAVDASGIPLYYEGIQNFCHLPQLRWLSLKGSHIDEWCLDFLSHHLPCLEYLDISNCKRVHERGLEALYKNFNLRTLIVTNHHNSKAFELTCLMLEEVLPHLECIILEPEQEKSEKVDAK